jgi:hypothetical protein
MLRSTIAGSCLLFLVAGAVSADERPLEPGERVRVTTSQQRSRRIVGRLVDDDGTRLVVDAEWKPSFADRILESDPAPSRRTVEIPWDTVMSLEVARGRRTNWPASLGFGLAAGGMATFLAAAAAGSQAPCAFKTEADCRRQEHELILVGVGLTVATAVGAALFAKTVRWAPAERRQVRLAIAAAPRHGVRVALSFGR